MNLPISLNRIRTIIVRMLFMLIVGLIAGCASHNNQETGIVITNGTILTMNANFDIIENGVLVIKGNKILDLGNENIIEKYSGYRIIDAKGGLVMPGMINTHSHLPMIAFRGLAEEGVKDRLFNYYLPLEKHNLSRDLIYKATIHAAIESAMSGVTTFADMYYHMDEMAKATKRIGVRAVLGETIIKYPVVDAPKPYGGLEYAIDFINEYKSDPLVTPAFAPHAPYSVSKEKLLEVIALSEKYDVPVLIHVAERPEESSLLPGKYKGRSPVYYLNDIGFLKENVNIAHAINLTDEDLIILKSVQCGVSHNPISNAKAGHSIARVYEMKQGDVRIGIGTDGPMSSNSLDLFATMRAVALLQRIKYKDSTIMNPIEIVEMATIGGAGSLHMEEKIGSIETGKLADVIIVDTKAPNMVPSYNPYAALVFQAEAANVMTTIINGKIIMEERTLRTFDRAEDLKNMEAIVRAISPFAKELEIKAQRGENDK